MPLFRRKPSTWDYFEEGMSFGGASKLSKAEASFREAARLAPEEPYPHYELGYTLTLLGRHEEALEEFRRTKQLTPRGFLLVDTEIYLCEQVLAGSIDSSALEALRSLQHLTDSDQGQSHDAVALSRKAIEAAPECALAHFYLGKALFEREPQAAEEALRRCVELHPDGTTAINARWHIAALRRRAGDEDEARRIWREIADEHPGHPGAIFADMNFDEPG